MRWIMFAIGLGLFSVVTGGAFVASVRGAGLPGLLDKPVSIRQSSVGGRRSGGMGFFYFGTRRHYGGGFRGGK